MHPVNFEEVIEKIAAREARYQVGAYTFMREALEHTQHMITKSKKGEIRHVSGKELLGGIREYALEQFGPMVVTVFADWGIQCCEDFGEIVFLMVENNLLAKTEKDTREDFKGGYDFSETFRKPFLPSKKTSETEPKTVSGVT
jgi:uncharacterized repeat protein (TIGR04138 family)